MTRYRPDASGRKPVSRATYAHGLHAWRNPPLTRAEADRLFADMVYPVWKFVGSGSEEVTYLDGILYKVGISSRGGDVILARRDPTATNRDDRYLSCGWRNLREELVWDSAARALDGLLAALWVDEFKTRLLAYLTERVL